MKQPKKPTQPFGHIAFGKDGSVNKIVNQLPDTKEEQEKRAIETFIESHNRLYHDRQISELVQLPEKDQDFTANIGDNIVEIQLTEISDTQYEISPDDPRYQNFPSELYTTKGDSTKLWKVDKETKNNELQRIISKKLSKAYAKSSENKLWLVIFTTDANFRTEYFEDGIRKSSEALKRARKHLFSLNKVDFDEIWFTNLQTKPIRIWPHSSKTMKTN